MKSIVFIIKTCVKQYSFIFQFPVDSAKKLSRSATEMLNNLGGRLVGLQR